MYVAYLFSYEDKLNICDQNYLKLGVIVLLGGPLKPISFGFKRPTVVGKDLCLTSVLSGRYYM